MSEDKIAERIYETLSRQTFADWYDGRFDDHIGDSLGPSKEDILKDIKHLFRLEKE